MVGEYYAEKRGIPAGNILYLDIPNTEEPLAWDAWHIPHARYEESIRQPLLKKLRSYPPEQRILYIVTTYGVPSRLQNFPNIPGKDGRWIVALPGRSRRISSSVW